MDATSKAPEVGADNFKRTKIIATIGPASDSYDTVLEMLKSGVNGFRLNFSHGTHDERKRQIEWIRKASKEYGKPAAIIQDLQGPKIRLGDFDSYIPIIKNKEVQFEYGVEYKEDGPIPTQYDLSKKVKRGERIMVFDGRIRLKVTSVRGKTVSAKAENDGVVTQRKGINLPDTDLKGDIITTKDKKDIAFGAENDIDYVAMSFVQNGKDVEKLQKILKSHNSDAKIISKVETKAAVENLDEIVEASDGVMVARGDLAIETEPESVPVVNRTIIGKCMEQGKVSIVATQMLASMTQEPEPTRAEVSDVATAVIVGADAVMLSDETASGKYPVESVQIMKRIIVYTQENSPLSAEFNHAKNDSIQNSISVAITSLAEQVKAKAIIAETKSGRTARSVANLRPTMPIIMVTSSGRVAQQLAIVYGGKSYVRPDSKTAGIKLTQWLRQHKVFKKGDIVVISSGKDPGVAGGTDTIKVRVLE